MRIVLIVIMLFFVFHSALVNGQIVRGKVMDDATGKAISDAHVFIEATQRGTITSADGHFSIEVDGHQKPILVVSRVGYLPAQSEKILFDSLLIIKLSPYAEMLDEVYVRESDFLSEKAKWNMFKQIFLGSSIRSKIKNPKDIYLYYDSEDSCLYARSRKPIIIEDAYLGYRIRYSLSKFIRCQQTYSYEGYSFYEDITNGKNKAFSRRRRREYKGSRMHFLKSLYRDTLKEEGFYLEDRNGNKINIESRIERKANLLEICFDGKVIIKYIGGNRIMTSAFSLHSECLEIQDNCFTYPRSIIWFGNMAYEGIGNSLPLDYTFPFKERIK